MDEWNDAVKAVERDDFRSSILNNLEKNKIGNKAAKEEMAAIIQVNDEGTGSTPGVVMEDRCIPRRKEERTWILRKRWRPYLGWKHELSRTLLGQLFSHSRNKNKNPWCLNPDPILVYTATVLCLPASKEKPQSRLPRDSWHRGVLSWHWAEGWG